MLAPDGSVLAIGVRAEMWKAAKLCDAAYDIAVRRMLALSKTIVEEDDLKRGLRCTRCAYKNMRPIMLDVGRDCPVCGRGTMEPIPPKL